MPQPLALVAGAGPGLGLALARRFASGGFRVAALVRPGELPEPFAEALGPDALVLPADLGDPGALGEALAHIQARLGFPELLVCHAASGARGALLEIPEEALRRDHQVNVLSPLACVRWARPAMRAGGRGTILVTGGGLALQPKPGEGAPALGKAAQRSLALTLAQELAPEGIHAATVTIAGWLQPGTPFSPEAAAEAFWALHAEPREAWRSEVVLRP